MAGSRKRPATTNPSEPLLEALRAAIAAAGAPGGSGAPLIEQPRRARAEPLLLGLSGGRDSVALLDAACRLRAARVPAFAQLRAVHVNHGLQPAAAAFAAHCQALCEQLGVPLLLRAVHVERRGRGLEAAAREARYAALAHAARETRARYVLTAHHLDDRIETFLIQWMRGAGPDGLAAFPPVRAFDGELRLLRPWLDIRRAQIDDYISRRALAYVDDPSNRDPTVLRSALRAQVLPALEQLRPGCARAAARSVELVSEAAAVLREVAETDLGHCLDEASSGTLRLDRLAQLSPPRRALVLRRWLVAQGVRALPRARTQQVLTQALHARADARLLLRLGDRELRRYRGLLLLRSVRTDEHGDTLFHWSGEKEIALPVWRGALCFVTTDGAGFDPDWLRVHPLAVRRRRGGERFKPHPTRPSRSLKDEFQRAGVPDYERSALPLVWRDGRLIFVAGLGPDARLIESGGPRVRLEWRPDAGLLG